MRTLAHPRERALQVLAGRHKRLLPLVLATGVIGGLVGAAYVEVLNHLSDVFFPSPWSSVVDWSNWSHWLVLLGASLLIALGVKVLGDPGDTELLVDNIHVMGGAPTEDVKALRSLIPVSLVGIAAGGGIGPEAPLTQTTGTLGSWLSMKTGLNRDDTRILTITGMAAGFTVLFAAPFGASVFALEILHRRGMEYYEALIPACMGSLVGYGISAGLTHLGLEPVWQISGVLHVPDALTFGDLGWALVCGAVGAGIAILFTYLNAFLQWLVRPVPASGKPVLAAIALGALAFASPYALTYSESQLAELGTLGTVTVATLVLAAGTKLVAAAVTMAGQWKGGFIIPMFFIGYCLGRAGAQVIPDVNGIVLATALMVAINVGVTKTPLGSTLVVAEMTGLKLLPTMLVAAVVSLLLTSGVGLIASQRQRESVLGEAEDQQGEDVVVDAPDPDRLEPTGGSQPKPAEAS